MPCRDYQSDHDYQDNIIESQKTRLDELTSLLCGVCSILQHEGTLQDYTRLNAWYIEHRKADIDNMQKMLKRLDVENLNVEEFDLLDSVLSKLV